MTIKEVKEGWERAERYAQAILEAKYLGFDVEGAKRKQKSLAVWISIIKEGGYVYNGSLDEYLTIVL
jgi:hypothetical protein